MAKNTEKTIKIENPGIFFVTFHSSKRLIYVEKSRYVSGKKKITDASEVKGQDVKSRDLAKIGHKARCETEEFINQHIHDRDKGWPVSLRLGADSDGAGPAQQVRKQGDKRASA
ncbi:MAG TPA: hypothetical protein VMY06_09645 [Sedimentisphaerales bacterium]|nr:hypothetical protein [Sedimentisphaerales bacterium]